MDSSGKFTRTGGALAAPDGVNRGMHWRTLRFALLPAALAAAAALAAGSARAAPPAPPPNNFLGSGTKADSTVSFVVQQLCPTKQACDQKDPATGKPVKEDTIQLVVSGSDLS